MANLYGRPYVRPSDDAIRNHLRGIERFSAEKNSHMWGCAGCERRRPCVGAYIDGTIQFFVCADCRRIAGFEP